MQETICAKVNPRLLEKADRLFTGSVEGRIIEMLQNARRAGATEVRITNKDETVTIADNGSGIEDFQKLLDLGGSGWDEKLEAGEDPAGVGLFSLASREVLITSGNRQVRIDKAGWTGKPMEISIMPNSIKGTRVTFQDERSWDLDLVEKHAVFAGINVIVDGGYCHRMPFCRQEAAFCREPGCNIEVTDSLSNYHRHWKGNWYQGRVLVNFHGQVVQWDYWPSKNQQNLTVLVDIADQTELRLMLPARTRLVENQALEQLKAAIEREYYRYFLRQKTHALYYEEYLRAKVIGIDLPEAAPQFTVGLIWSEYNEAVEVSVPKDFKVESGYLCLDEDCDDDNAEVNAHLLAALGTFEDYPFVPVKIDRGYKGYNWSKLSKVTKVEVIKGQEKLCWSIYCGKLACFDSLAITVHTSDGQRFNSNVPMAVVTKYSQGQHAWAEEIVCVTEAARNQLVAENIWFHLGGYSDEGDTYETQLDFFEKELNEFWSELIGPYESLRRELLEVLGKHNDLYDCWQNVAISSDGVLEIVFKDGSKKQVNSSAIST